MKLNTNGNIKTTRTTKNAKMSYRGRAKIKKAEASYREMIEEIKPFIRQRKISQYSTAGQWKVLSHET